jgi:imidazolonepropionase-like amidohydrolase
MRRIRRLLPAFALAFLPLAGCQTAPPPAARAAQPMTPQTAAAPASAGEVRYGFLFSGNLAGSAVTRKEADGSLVCTFEYNDRGRGSNTTSRYHLDAAGVPVTLVTTGNDYLKSPVEEHFDRQGAHAVWKSNAEKGEHDVQGPAFFLSLNGPPQETALLAKALLATPDHRLPLLPTGEARLEEISSSQVRSGGESRQVHLYSISGMGFTPTYLWLDDQQDFFAAVWGWAVVYREGWKDVVADLTKVQDGAEKARSLETAKQLSHHPEGGGLAIRHARLFDPATKTVLPDMTIVVSGNHIQAVGKDAEVTVPPGLETIDAKGKMVLPGLWDMHVHLSEDQGLFDLASGVTSVRDLANDVDQLLDMRRRWASGEGIGPRVLMAGFMDGPGPFAGPTKVLVSTEKEALDWVDRYAKLGYVQIKLYSSLDPALVPAIVKRAHQLGLRVSGHIPKGMNAEQAVREGFDEIQHVNFLMLNFLDPKIDTRTPARFAEVAKQGADLDLKSDRVKRFIALLKERGTVSDPTLATFEGMFKTEAGEIDPGLAAVADRLPPQVQRGLYGGGLNPPHDQIERYRASYRKMQEMVKALYDAGVTLVAGTDAIAGFTLHRELELWVDSGIPAPYALSAATLGAARVMKRDAELGSVTPGKLADLILVDGDPVSHISDIRRVVLTVKDGVVFDPAALWREVGVRPVE